MNQTTKRPENRTPEYLAQLEQMCAEFTSAQLAKSTQRGYHYDWVAFTRWAETMGLPVLPATPQTLKLFIAEQISAGFKVSTATHRMAAIAQMHTKSGLPSPVTPQIIALLRGARKLRCDQLRQALPLTVAELTTICTLLVADDTPISIRNRALLLVQFTTAMRNSNTAAMLISDVEFMSEGALLRLRKSKTDQTGRGAFVSLLYGKHPHTDVVGALKKWIELRGSDTNGSPLPGPLFTRFDGSSCKDRGLTPVRIGQIVQELCARIGLNGKLYSGHSLRAGFITETGTAGATDLNIATQTGHKSMDTLRRYFRKRDSFKANPAELLDL